MSSIYDLIVGSVESLSRKAGLNSLITHTFYESTIDENAVIVDLGANVGSFAREVTNSYRCKCYAVEALPQYCDEIVENEFVRKFNIAISDKNGPISIHVSANREANSIDQAIAEDWGYDGTAAACDDMTLETFLDNNGISEVDLLKIDIEGAERHLFDSTTDGTLARMKRITIEFHDFIPGSITAQQVNAIFRRLRNLGFYCIPMSYLYPSMLNADVLFINTAAISVKSSDKLRFSLINALLHAERFKSGIPGWQKHRPERAMSTAGRIPPYQSAGRVTAQESKRNFNTLSKNQRSGLIRRTNLAAQASCQFIQLE